MQHSCFHSFSTITLLFFSLFLSACSNPWVTQSVPSFSSASSSLAPLSSFPPVPPQPPATRQPEAHLTSVREPGPSLTMPTSLPSAPEPGIGAGEDLSSCQCCCCNAMPFLVLVLLSFHVFFCLPSISPASWLSEWRPSKSHAPLAQPALSPKFLHPSATDHGRPALLQKKQKIELPCNASLPLTYLITYLMPCIPYLNPVALLLPNMSFAIMALFHPY